MTLDLLDKALDMISNHDPRGRVSLLLGDCLEIMSDMPKNSVHLIATDPPYFLDGMDDEWNASKRTARSDVVGGLPAGMKFDRKQGLRLQEFYSQVSKQAYRILVPGGFFLSFASPRLYHRMAMAMDECGFELRDMLSWRYRNGGQQKAFTMNHFVERMSITDENKQKIIQSMGGRKTPQIRPQFEPIGVGQKPREGTFIENWQKWKTGLVDLTETRVSGRKPTTVLEFDKPVKDTYNSHLTVKPVPLMEVLIRIFSSEGQTVLDPFAGSGSTLLAARNTRRESIGIEVNPEYHSIATNRLRGKPTNET